MNPIMENKENLIKLRMLLIKSSKAKFQKYNSKRSTYEKKVIKQILNNHSTSIASKFKDCLIFDDFTEFFKRL